MWSSCLRGKGGGGSLQKGDLPLVQKGQCLRVKEEAKVPGLEETRLTLVLKSGKNIPGRGDSSRKGLEEALGSSQGGGLFQLLMGSEPAPGAGRVGGG